MRFFEILFFCFTGLTLILLFPIKGLSKKILLAFSWSFNFEPDRAFADRKNPMANGTCYHLQCPARRLCDDLILHEKRFGFNHTSPLGLDCRSHNPCSLCPATNSFSSALFAQANRSLLSRGNFFRMGG